jgi:hypothetical protein
MIKPDAKLSIERLPLECLQCKEYQQRYPNMLLMYIQKMLDYPGEYAGLLSVTPSDTHPGMYALLDGHNRFCAYIMAGRPDALCVIIEEGKGNATHV